MRKKVERFPLIWLNILSLDAPLVAVCWQLFFSRLFHRPLGWFHPVLLATVTWLAYSGDRILDGFRSDRDADLAPRHSFAIRYRIPLVIVWLLVFSGSLGVGYTQLDREILIRGLILTGSVAFYFGLVFLSPRMMRRIIPREIAVSGLFVLGTGCFVFQPVDLKSVEVWSALFWFGAVCFINCILISFWEREIDLQNEEVSAATTSPRLGTRANLFIVTTLGVVLLCWFTSPFASVRWVLVPVGFSLILFLFLNGSRIDRERKPVLADLALLTPLFVLGFI